jgi:2-(1,2-epoxy-1,2-dihydrophenyl)acetyl-CoA isomerase
MLDPFARFGTLMRGLRNLDKPVLGAINGVAAGAGLSLALICDLRIASEKARFSSIFVNVACNPDTGTSYYLPRVVGVAKALEMIWTGDFVNAEEALRIGLVNRVVPHDELMPATKELAVRLAQGPSLAHEFAKRLVYHGLEANSYEAQLAYEAYALSVCFQSSDVKEGGQAFRDKRKPEFKGR